MSRADRERLIKKRRIKSVIFIALELFFASIMVFSSIKIYKWYDDNKKNKNLINEANSAVSVVNENNQDVLKVDFDILKEKNSDVIGWINVNNTDVSFPVVQAQDNEYYLNHSLDKSVNGAGWIFADYRNKLDGSDKNIIIYGHNRRDNSMFGTLKNILDEDWYENSNNKIVRFVTENMYSEYEVFSVYQIEDEDYYITTDFSGDEFKNYINEMKSRSIKDFGTEVNEDDQILTLSTCANNNKYRVVLHAKKIK